MSFNYTFAPKAECLLCSMVCPTLGGTRTLLCHLGRSHMLAILIYCILIMAFSKTYALVLQSLFEQQGSNTRENKEPNLLSKHHLLSLDLTGSGHWWLVLLHLGFFM